MREVHPIKPVFDENSKVLILGSFPSVLSRKTGFYYGHPQNRFWRVLAAVMGETVPASIEEKRLFLLKCRIALWDVIASCEVEGSSDGSIRSVVPNDLGVILKNADIGAVFTNGGTAARLYRRYCLPITGIEAAQMPSTSPANAQFSYEKLCEKWRPVAEKLND